MRVTNTMMLNNSLSQINTTKNIYNKYQTQLSTQKKIQKPSEDPVIAIRAMNYRTTYSELNQYIEKNIPDALSWLDVTETALDNTNTLLQDIYQYCVQGSNDTYETVDKNTILENLVSLRSAIYDEGDMTYAGRYIFTGFRTDTSLTFQKDTQIEYDITENFNYSDIEAHKYITDRVTVSDETVEELTSSDEDVKEPWYNDMYRIRLSYDKLDEADADNKPIIPSVNVSYKTQVQVDTGAVDGEGNPVYDDVEAVASYSVDADGNASLTYADADGNPITPAIMPDAKFLATVSSDEAAFKFEDGDIGIHYLADTGELVISEDLRKAMVLDESSNLKITYQKSDFSKGELRPEHYYECTSTDADGKQINYNVGGKEEKSIDYIINASQTIQVNTEGEDVFVHDIARDVDDLIYAINKVIDVEQKIAKVKAMKEDTAYADDKSQAALDKMLVALNVEKDIAEDEMENRFEEGVDIFEDHRLSISETIANVGTRMKRVELAQTRMYEQRTMVEEMMTDNEGVEMSDSVINYSEAQVVYNAALSAASKAISQTLLDFL